ncbi:hypothetical protein H6G04_22190 [Calothrix membranacea FACHB-236]|nr:hypothetical protein [Calothrix membranacea FACHB-236]
MNFYIIKRSPVAKVRSLDSSNNYQTIVTKPDAVMFWSHVNILIFGI